MVYPLRPFEQVTYTGEMVLILKSNILERYTINKNLIFRKKIIDDKLSRLTDTYMQIFSLLFRVAASHRKHISLNSELHFFVKKKGQMDVI